MRMTVKSIVAVFMLSLSLLVAAQALSSRLDDLDAATLATMQAQAGCKAPRDVATKLCCDGLDAFAHGGPLDKKAIDQKRLIGVEAAVSARGGVEPSLKLLAFLYRRARDFHSAVELGDSATAVPVKPDNAKEEAEVAQAAALVAQGKTPVGNGAFQFAQSMNIDNQLVHTRLTSGSSTGLEGRNRELLRQTGRRIVRIELPFQNSHVNGKPFWVSVFDLK